MMAEWLQVVLLAGIPLLCLAIGVYIEHKFGNHDGWPW